MASQWEKDMMNLLGPQNPTELEWYGDPRCRGESSPSLVSESDTDTGSPSCEGSEIVTIPRTPQKNSCHPGRNLHLTRAERLENVV